MMKKKNWIWILLAALAVAILILVLGLRGCAADPPGPSDPPDLSGPSSSSTESVSQSEPSSSESSSQVTPSTRPSASAPTPQPPADPVVYDPNRILARAKELLVSSSGTAVSSLTNPKTVSVTVPETQDVETSALAIVNQVKAQLAREQAQMAPGGTFTYQYTLLYQGAANGQYTYIYSYRAVSGNYEVTQQQYDTSRLVADICAYLDGKGKTKFDSYGMSGVASSSVIVLIEYDYPTALSIVKAQVESFTAGYRQYDFYFTSPTVTVKGGVEKEALLFTIVGRS